MMKKRLSWITMGLVFLVVFNIVFFALLKKEIPTSVWISYIFVHVSYLCLLATPLLIPRKNDPDSFAYPLYSISGIHFFVTLVACIVFMCIKAEENTYSLITHAIITGVYVLLFVAHRLAGEAAGKKYELSTKDAMFIDHCCMKLELLKNENRGNETVFLKLTEAYEIVHSSPTRKNQAVYDLEENVRSIIDSLRNTANQGLEAETVAKIDTLIHLFNERNIILKNG